MNWGCPRVLPAKDGCNRKPSQVTNVRDNNLKSPFWRDSFANRRLLIPLTAWAEPQREAGRMTGTWYAAPGEEALAVGGIWRPSGMGTRLFNGHGAGLRGDGRRP